MQIEEEPDIEFAKNWKVVYPLYLDKSVPREGGRRVPAAKAIEMPDVEDIRQVLSLYKIPHVVELNKNHPRDFYCMGRVRYNLKNNEGQLITEELKNSTHW